MSVATQSAIPTVDAATTMVAESAESDAQPTIVSWDADDDDDGYMNDCGTFDVSLKRSSRGLGFTIAGGIETAPISLIRIGRIFPHLEAWSTGMLRPGDILLAANGVALTGLTNAAALDILRGGGGRNEPIITLTVCRTNDEQTAPTMCPAPSVDCSPPATLPKHSETALVITMTKLNGSLGFTLRKESDSERHGHHVSALVRPPATTAGLLRVGDRIDRVNGTAVDRMRHEELVLLLRSLAADEPVRLVVCRRIDVADEMATDKGGQHLRTMLPLTEEQTRQKWCGRFGTDDRRVAAAC